VSKAVLTRLSLNVQRLCMRPRLRTGVEKLLNGRCVREAALRKRERRYGRIVGLPGLSLLQTRQLKFAKRQRSFATAENFVGAFVGVGHVRSALEPAG